jgi:hypothetical protein
VGPVGKKVIASVVGAPGFLVLGLFGLFLPFFFLVFLEAPLRLAVCLRAVAVWRPAAPSTAAASTCSVARRPLRAGSGLSMLR